jgi:hypothetical protein
VFVGVLDLGEEPQLAITQPHYQALIYMCYQLRCLKLPQAGTVFFMTVDLRMDGKDRPFLRQLKDYLADPKKLQGDSHTDAVVMHNRHVAVFLCRCGGCGHGGADPDRNTHSLCHLKSSHALK